MLTSIRIALSSAYILSGACSSSTLLGDVGAPTDSEPREVCDWEALRAESRKSLADIIDADEIAYDWRVIAAFENQFIVFALMPLPKDKSGEILRDVKYAKAFYDRETCKLVRIETFEKEDKYR